MLLAGHGGSLLWPVFLLGVASELEAIAIMLVLPAWRAEVRGLAQPLALRGEARGCPTIRPGDLVTRRRPPGQAG
ncbi:hypothetical protein [Phenylobacterium sp.]|jgi:CDP-diacylglycerol--glycerol-3-phosphate 3-phosphatidyltransferase|uniref:hypothetical protein n=1 Tax=Phenylobacterium sp. TaxID=1871053 RepID=UPI002F94B30B